MNGKDERDGRKRNGRNRMNIRNGKDGRNGRNGRNIRNGSKKERVDGKRKEGPKNYLLNFLLYNFQLSRITQLKVLISKMTTWFGSNYKFGSTLLSHPYNKNANRSSHWKQHPPKFLIC